MCKQHVYFSACINQKPNFPTSYMYLAVTLAKLDDFENACSAYEKAIDMEEDHLFRLNYAITLYSNEEFAKAREHYAAFERIFDKLDTEVRAHIRHSVVFGWRPLRAWHVR